METSRNIMRENNHQINNTSYYRLPCGKYLEDFIQWKNLSFAEGSALKYLYRAGKKDGESRSKDHEKALHYIRYLAEGRCVGVSSVQSEVQSLLEEAKSWNGNATCEESSVVGNAAKMRKALEGVRDWLLVHNAYVDTEREIVKLNNTLAEPPRNCDKFNPDKALNAYCEDRGIIRPLPLWYGNEFWAFIQWLFDKAKGAEK